MNSLVDDEGRLRLSSIFEMFTWSGVISVFTAVSMLGSELLPDSVVKVGVYCNFVSSVGDLICVSIPALFAGVGLVVLFFAQNRGNVYGIFSGSRVESGVTVTGNISDRVVGGAITAV